MQLDWFVYFKSCLSCILLQPPSIALQTRIIGGNEALDGRYPYAVALTNFGSLYCGGSVIAPDLILTAAHCADVGNGVQIGRYDRSNTLDTFERFSNLQEYVHPKYQSGVSLRYDKMIIKISGFTTTSPVRLNSNFSLPLDGTEVIVMGWGITNASDQESLSNRLLEVSVNTLTNEACANSKSPLFLFDSYKGQIFDDMLCAIDEGQDSCQGDSGGPLILPGNDASGDVQLAVVSWGYGCAILGFPGVYSRISYDYDWIKSTVCEVSAAPPSDFNCVPSAAPVSSAPTPTPSAAVIATDMEGFIGATIEIQVDDNPQDIGFKVDLLGFTVVNVIRRQAGIYTKAGEVVSERIFLQEGELYSFTIFDVKGDGFCCLNGNGNFSLTLDGGNTIISSSGDIADGKSYDFIASMTNSSTLPPALIDPGDTYLTLEITFDDFPGETGWILQLINNDTSSSRLNPTVDYRPPQTYKPPLARQTITEVIPIPSNSTSFVLHMTDSNGDGLCCLHGHGNFTVYNGNASDGLILAQGTAENTGRKVVSFSLSSGQGDAPSSSSVEQNSTFLPGVSSLSPATTDEITITLTIQTDQYPKEIGWYLQDPTTGTKLLQRLPGYYSVKEFQKIEQLKLTRNTAYEFVITDEYENGLCCDYGIGGFVLSQDNVIIYSGGRFSQEDRFLFVTDGDFPVQLVTSTDEYPTEFFWYLERLDMSFGIAKVARSRGYNETNQVEREDVLLQEGGLYRLRLLGLNYGGICCEHGKGQVEIKVGTEMETIATIFGKFGADTSHTFLAGAQLSLPINVRNLTLQILFDDFPGEFSWLLLGEESEISIAAKKSSGNSQRILAFGPETQFADNLMRKTIVESIEIEEIPVGTIRTFTFVALDQGGDGLCCLSGKGEWKLFDGSVSENNLLIDGTIKNCSRDAKTFSLSIVGGMEVVVPSPSPSNRGADTLKPTSDAITMSARSMKTQAAGLLSLLFLLITIS